MATRKNFDPSGYGKEELDRIKLEDGIRIHEDTKVALEIYARNEQSKAVKPFVLVVTKDTEHASQVKALIQSNAFFEGRYADKVMEIHSNQRGEEKEENIQQLLTLEDPENKIEIVIHVNMLKEGWDVTNLYTIIPLRASASETLTEQTIGRGLRLPYGKRTGDDKVDKLTIVAHDNFQRIIEEANKPGSIIKQKNIIEIPRITIQPSDEVNSGFHDFELDAKNLNYASVSEEILIHFLARRENSEQTLIGKYGIAADKPENMILNELISLPEVDYDTQSELLYKLVGQAIAKLSSYLTEEELINVVKFHKKEIAGFIYAQMKPYFYCTTKSFEEPIVKPFTEIEGHNLTKIQADSIHHFTDTITPTSAIPQKVFSGFKKSCHSLCRFDAKGEKDFAALLENDKEVVKWLRPAPKQFKIYWDLRDSRTYEPDFVVETSNIIYLAEIKADNQLEQAEVLAKARAALQYCKYASKHTQQNGGKPWKYLLIPHTEVLPNMSMAYLAGKREFAGRSC